VKVKKLLGKRVCVFLKGDNDIVSGILFDIDDECVYVQTDVDVFAVIPKENVKYYTSSQSDVEVEVSREPEQEAEQHIPSSLSVFIDQVFIVDIPVPPTFDLSSFNDSIMKITLGNPDVQVVLSNRTQKSVEYFPGQIHIITGGEDYTAPVPVEPNAPQPPQDSFTMSGAGSPVSTYLNPSQMVGRLNKIARKEPEEVKNEE
jgi:hypothetical protein